MSGYENSPDYGSGPRNPLWYLLIAVVIAAMTFWLYTCSNAHGQPREIVGLSTVVDGDTIEIHGERIRLSGFDAPESGKRCGRTNVYSQAAFTLAGFTSGKTVSCAPSGRDNYGRTVAVCRVEGRDLGERMVASGWARDWPRYSHGAYADEEARARRSRAGIWGLSCPADLWGNRNYN